MDTLILLGKTGRIKEEIVEPAHQFQNYFPYIPLPFRVFTVDPKGRNFGSLGLVVRKFDSPKSSKTIIIKKLRNPFENQVRDKLIPNCRRTNHQYIVDVLESDTAKDGADKYQMTNNYDDVTNNVEMKAKDKDVWHDLKKWMREFAQERQLLYSKEVVFRDLLPRNICIGTNNKLTLIGIGKSRAIERDNNEDFNAINDFACIIEFDPEMRMSAERALSHRFLRLPRFLKHDEIAYIPPTLTGLPPEMLIKIAEDECITVEDRKRLRLTCSLLKNIVENSDFYADQLSIRINDNQQNSVATNDSTIVDMTGSEGPVTETQRCVDLSGNNSTCMDIMSTLFRRAHFKTIEFYEFNFEKNSMDNVLLRRLQLLSEKMSCDKLIIGRDCHYGPSAFDIIKTLNPKHLCIFFQLFPGERRIDEKALLSLPPVLGLHILESDFNMTDVVILELVKKHRWFRIDGNAKRNVQPETIVSATKIVAERGHYLEIPLKLYRAVECLQLMGVSCIDHKFVSLDGSVKVSGNSSMYGESEEVTDYIIEVHGTIIKMFDVVTDSNFKFDYVDFRIGVE